MIRRFGSQSRLSTSLEVLRLVSTIHRKGVIMTNARAASTTCSTPADRYPRSGLGSDRLMRGGCPPSPVPIIAAASAAAGNADAGEVAADVASAGRVVSSVVM